MIATLHEGLHKTGIGLVCEIGRAQEVFLRLGGGGGQRLYKRKEEKKGHADGKGREREEKRGKKDGRSVLRTPAF